MLRGLLSFIGVILILVAFVAVTIPFLGAFVPEVVMNSTGFYIIGFFLIFVGLLGFSPPSLIMSGGLTLVAMMIILVVIPNIRVV